MVKIRIYGCVNDSNLYYSEALAKKLVASIGNSDVQIFPLFEIDYLMKLEEFKSTFSNQLLYYPFQHLVLMDNQFIGDIKAFISKAEQDYSITDEDISNTIIFNRLVRENTYQKFQSNPNPIVYLSFDVQDAKRPSEFVNLGMIYIELFANLCPKACEHFQLLCQGVRQINSEGKTITYKYQDCPINRLVKNGWFQTGDIVDGTGKHSMSVLTGFDNVPDESFSVDFGFLKGGILGFANEGAHCNKSQFFVTLGPCAWMNHKFVGFGRVVQGYSILKEINQIATNNQVPSLTIKISDCGIPKDL